MGSIAIASCSCGYQSGDLLIGGGMRSFQNSCCFPALCREGDHLVTVNMFDEPRHCPDGHKGIPTPYNDGSLFEKRGRKVVVNWVHRGHSLELTDGAYLCPNCHKFGLEYSWTGMWD